ncbi:MAG: hypothetical protein OXC92_01310 [Flavobacteriaceae bacterium]|nr:hypothetical protein [Flavobacteriaceae bacterium]MCY4215608.1 hypothetical protein [Flavobacteriaceae bacterium]
MRNRDEATENGHPKKGLQTVADSIAVVPRDSKRRPQSSNLPQRNHLCCRKNIP